jgi:hypothetical protein
MTHASGKELVRVLEELFGDRCKPHGDRAGPLATVIPADAGELGTLAETVRRMGRTGVIVRATLGVRQTKGDRPFAAAFERPEALQRAISSLLERRPPLWHLGFVNPPMSRAMRAREEYLIFGAYAASDAGAAESELARTFGVARGRTVESAGAYRMWGSRFFPVSSAHAIPAPSRVLVPASRVEAVLDRLGGDPEELALLGFVGREGSALMLAFASPAAEGFPLGLSTASEAGLVGVARSVGGDPYHEILKRRAALRSRPARRS